MNRTVKKIWNAVTWVLVLCVLALAILLSGTRFFGLTPYAVLSGSMEPTYHVGSLIYVRETPPEEIRVGDPITFRLSGDGVVATHRVVEIDADGRAFYTKGDANEAKDGAPVSYNNLIGKPIFTIPMLGFFSTWITAAPGKYIAICGALVLLVLFFLPGLLDKADAADRKEARGKGERDEE